MKKTIKKLIKFFVSDKFIHKYKYAWGKYSKKAQNSTLKNKIKCLLFETNKYHFINENNISKIFKLSNKDIKFSNYFSYFIDFNYVSNKYEQYNNNMTPDYSIILKYSLNDLKKIFATNEEVVNLINELIVYLNKYVEKISSSNFKNKDEVIRYLENIKDSSCTSLKEAFQRILFFNQIFWQLGYNLCGLGRLDYILTEYVKKDDDVENYILDFLNILNMHYYEKSGCLSGDTGQIIILGGVDNKGNPIYNSLTKSFISALKKHGKPDPKLLLRITKKMPREYLKAAIDLILTGIGSPLLSNDDIIIKKLVEYGYSKNDSWNYVTAACWEPSPCGDSIDLNSILTLNFLEPFNELFIDCEISNISKENLLDMYFKKLKEYIKQKLNEVSNTKFASQPYLSIFIRGCRDTATTIDKGKVKYKNLGITTLGLSNVVNSILNINRFVFESKQISLIDLNENRKSNFNDKKVLKMLKQNNKYGYCSSNEEAIHLTNQIIEFISTEFEKFENYYGGKFKFGLSAPSYVEHGKLVDASFDGRKKGDPLNVHISSNNNSFLEIMRFASKINYYKNAINGNVVDFIINPNYIKNNKDKFSEYITAYMSQGIYQLQMNVIDSKTLMQAKKNPELYKNLIVRVWGFSAYFNDLPEEYQDLLIERAKSAEGLSEENE